MGYKEPVDGDKIVDGSVGNADIANDAVDASKIAANAVGSSEIDTDAVGGAEIAADAIGSSEIATDAVGSAEIVADAVGSSEIAVDAVGSSEVAADAIGSSEIATGAVGTLEVLDDTLTNDDFGSQAINMYGLNGSRPAAGSVAPGTTYLSTDINGGTQYISDGVSTWTQVAPGVNSSSLVVAKYASITNISVASAPATIDGASPSNGDIILLVNQGTASQNGLWTYNGSGNALTRPSNFNSGSTITDGFNVFVQQGTASSDSIWILRTNTPITVDTTSLSFAPSASLVGGANDLTTLTSAFTGVFPVWDAAAGRWLVASGNPKVTAGDMQFGPSGRLLWGSTTAYGSYDCRIIRSASKRLFVEEGSLKFGTNGDTRGNWPTLDANALLLIEYGHAAIQSTDGVAELKLGITGDSFPKLTITSAGVINFGSGSGAVDTNIYRGAANILKTDDSLHVDGQYNNTTDFTSDAILTAFRVPSGGIVAPFAGATQYAFAAGVAANAYARFKIRADGRQVWGPGTGAQDLNLYRDSSGLLRTDYSLQVDGSVKPGVIEVIPQSTGNTAYSSRGGSDVADRFRVTVAGQLSWGNGTTIDTSLARFAANQLSTADTFIALDGIATKTKAGIPVDGDFATTPPDGTMVVDTTNDRLYVRTNGAWKYTSLT